MIDHPKLSICLPTNSTLERSRQTLDSLHSLVQMPGIESVICDNAADSAKRAALRPLTHDSFRYVESPEPEVMKNWEFGLREVRGDLTCFLSDDDLLLALPGFSLDSLNASEGQVGFRPQMALYTQARGIYSITTYGIEAPRALGRIQQYIDLNGGANTTLFSFYRSQVLKDLYAELVEFHPTRGGFADWAVVLGLLSTGNLPAFPQMLYIYNNRNWETSEAIARNTVKTFLDAGLPEDCVRIAPVLQALDSIGTICRAASPIPASEKIEAAFFVLDGFFNVFRAALAREDAAALFGRHRWSVADQLVRACISEVDKVAAGLLIVDTWLPGYADKYREYFRRTLDRALLPILT